MSDPGRPWSDNHDAPQISKSMYIHEKTTLAGSFIGAILYGFLITLFFQCILALLNPVYRRGEGVKWWLVCHTLAMFSFVTVYTAMNLYIQSNSFIDHRELAGASGPVHYQTEIRQTALGLVPNIMFNLNNWLADGLLIYRCYIIYSTKLWAIALPCLMYLTSIGMGTMSIYYQHQGFVYTTSGLPKFGVPYLSISVSLNVLLTSMIVVRLILHGRRIHAAAGSTVGIGLLYRAIATMLIESCAVFTVNSLLVVGALASAETTTNHGEAYSIGGYVMDIFFPILAEIQVIAPMLIIQRVAKRSALTNQTITAGPASSLKFRRQGELSGSDGAPLGGNLANSADGYGKNPGESGIVVEKKIDFRPYGEV